MDVRHQTLYLLSLFMRAFQVGTWNYVGWGYSAGRKWRQGWRVDGCNRVSSHVRLGPVAGGVSSRSSNGISVLGWGSKDNDRIAGDGSDASRRLIWRRPLRPSYVLIEVNVVTTMELIVLEAGSWGGDSKWQILTAYTYAFGAFS